MHQRVGRARETNHLTLHCVRGVFEMALDAGLIRSNPTRKAKPSGHPSITTVEFRGSSALVVHWRVVGFALA